MFDDCKSLNDAARKLFGKANYTNREKIKKILAENGMNWEEWLVSVKERETRYCIVCGKKLEKGQVKEEGTHRELIAKNGLYADMYKKQAENYLADKTKQTEGIWA